MAAQNFEDVAALQQIRDGGVLFVEVGGRDVLLFRRGDTIVALGANCTHAFASLAEARIEGTVIICRAHGARFDLNTGRSLNGSCPNLPVYAAKVVGRQVLVSSG
jgi:nitrite reductase/ring-hydroxylating ferredoxin subunit